MNILGIIASSKFGDAGDFESIATTLLTATASSVTFSSIPATFDHLQIRYISQTNRATFGRDVVRLQINSFAVSNYASHFLSGDGATASAGAETTANNVFILSGVAGTTTAGADFFGASIVDILDYKNTNKNKTIRTLGGVDVNGTVGGAGGEVVLQSGLLLSTDAITSLTLKPNTGTLFSVDSHFALYGIRSA